ncbi:TonB-dependent receptor [Hymenobacter psychrotolerans]|uniref:Iron complex outermembrane recepter protein n=1 Tax=Hymenobacter psychrotolerans DSM 18569 TaxID=1121959 RepID=A0A1M7FLJ5_9BACT|nr:TonB-dependent receptor [Hymenobacter psychrotolerans]SHM04893.1 iron complex outermembrane recepter protein [Hymenobacter psychrotolerans DSM 18569]
MLHTTLLLLISTAPPDTTRRVQQLGEVVVAASKVEESILQSPVTVEKLTARQLRLTPAPSFFEAIEHVKGVQVITPSLGFKVINARGFSNTTNVRFAQLVDGIDNQAPHIGGPIGNVLGPSDLDIQAVEIVPGTAAALYGLNAINGLTNFSTRNPFRSEGLSVQQKAGANHVNDANTGAHVFSETSVRYAKAVSPKLAFKVNGTYLRGYDWMASDPTDINPNGNATTGLLGPDNPARDPVGSYGNESSNRSNLTLGGKTYQVARTGYREQDVVDYRLHTLRYDAALHYKLNPRAELAYTYRGANFDNVYQRSNRFQLSKYHLQQHALQLTTPVVQARAYFTRENTGRSYNLRSMAENLDRSFKSDADWNREYTSAWNRATQDGHTVAQAHAAARAAADAGRLQPGTPAFQQRLRELADINNWDQGAALRVRAGLLHAEGQVNVGEALRRDTKGLPAWADLLVGLDHRTYFIQPDGNYFINPEQGEDPYSTLTYGKTGGFVQAGARLLEQKIRLTATLRADKNDYFSARFNPRFTAVYSPTQRHNFRLSYQSGYRFPSLFEGFSNVNSGQVKRIGGLRVMSDGVFENSYLRSSIDAFGAAVTRDVNTGGLSRSQAIARNQQLLVKNPYTYLLPEHIRSLELGYKAALLPGGHLLTDVDFYYNTYRDFIAQVEAYVPVNAAGEPLAAGADLGAVATALSARAGQARYRLWTNSQSQVYNYGGSLGLRYDVAGGYLAGASVTYARLDRTESADGLEDGFNTPRWAYNLSLGNEDVIKNFGFGLNFRWQARYYSQTFLVTGYVPAYSTLDAQVSYRLPTPNLRLKLGASNLLNHYYVSYLGGPGVGGLYYLQMTYGL